MGGGDGGVRYDRDGDRVGGGSAGGATAGGVPGGVAALVRAVEVGVGRVSHAAAVGAHRAESALGKAADGERVAVGVTGVCQHAERDGGVLISAGAGVGGGDGGI